MTSIVLIAVLHGRIYRSHTHSDYSDDVDESATLASSSQAAIAGLTSSQLNSAQLKALRKDQEQAQAEAREKKTRDDAEKEEKHMADRQVCRKAYIAKHDKLPPCPLRCRGKECTKKCATNLDYRHDMIDCKILAQASGSGNVIGNCQMWHKRAPKNFRGGTSGARSGPRRTGQTATQRKPNNAGNAGKPNHNRNRIWRCLLLNRSWKRQRVQMHHMQTLSRINLRPSNSRSSRRSSRLSSSVSSSSSSNDLLLPLLLQVLSR
jgi:hypothetical protein